MTGSGERYSGLPFILPWKKVKVSPSDATSPRDEIKSRALSRAARQPSLRAAVSGLVVSARLRARLLAAAARALRAGGGSRVFRGPREHIIH